MSKPTKLQVYGSFASQPTRAVIFLCEIGNIPYELIEVSVIQPRHKRADYIKNMNPNGRIPSIKDTNGFVVYEAAAILQYLCNRYQLTDVYPIDLKLRAKIDEYCHWHHESTRYLTTAYVGMIMRVDVPLKQWILGTDIMQRRKTLRYALDIIENIRLKKHDYIAGDSLSIADILCYEEIVQLDVWNLFDDGKDLRFDGDGTKYIKRHYPNIHRWCLKMRQLPKHDYIHQALILPPFLQHVIERKAMITKAFTDLASKL
eukprot:665544_1